MLFRSIIVVSTICFVLESEATNEGGVLYDGPAEVGRGTPRTRAESCVADACAQILCHFACRPAAICQPNSRIGARSITRKEIKPATVVSPATTTGQPTRESISSTEPP